MRPAAREWELAPAGHRRAEWKARVLPVLEHFVDRTPGSFIEEKEFALVWHYRLADPEFGEWLANELVATLDEMLAETELHAIRGQKTVEVRLVVGEQGRDGGPPGGPARRDADFRLAIGDDRTDEDLFERLRGEAWTVRVGEGPSSARYSLPGPPEVRAVLERVLEVAERVPQPTALGGRRAR